MKDNLFLLVGIIGVFLGTGFGYANETPYAVRLAGGAPSGGCFQHTTFRAMVSQTEMDFTIDTHTGSQVGMNFYLLNDYYMHGIKFCPTHVKSGRSNLHSSPWMEKTRFGNADDCFVVCETGYFGNECSQTGTPTSCSAAQIKLRSGDNNNYNTGNAAALSDVLWLENSRFGQGELSGWFDCTRTNVHAHPGLAAHRHVWHGKTLAVKRATSDGFGVVVQPLMFWPYCQQSTYTCRITVTPAGSETVMCLNGYKPSETVQGCVPIDGKACAHAIRCDGWEVFNDADSQYRKYVKPEDTCYQYRCAASGYGFAGNPLGFETDRKCVECPTTHTQGIGDDGVCLVGGTGELYLGGEIVEAKQSKMSDLKKCWDNDSFLDCLEKELSK